DLRKVRQRLRAEVGEHDPLRLKVFAMLHELAIRDVRWIVAFEERRFANEKVGALRDGRELRREARIARIGDELPRDLDPQTVRLGHRNVTHWQRGHARAAHLGRLCAEHDGAEWEAERGRPVKVWVERLLL